MKISFDMSGLDNFINGLDEVITDIPAFNERFIEEEWMVFLHNVIPHTPEDTGEMINSYQLGEITHIGTITKADWANLVPYYTFVNNGTIFIQPRKMWEKGLHGAEANRENRFQVMFNENYEEIMLKHL